MAASCVAFVLIFSDFYVHLLKVYILINITFKLSRIGMDPGGGGGGTWVQFCWVCAAGLSESLPHYSLFFGHL